MRADIRFGRFGAEFYCRKCGHRLKAEEGDILRHPDASDVVCMDKLVRECPHLGSRYVNPFVGVELKELEP